MHPLLYSGQHLPIIDLKLKLDNKQSKEINLGLVYRYNVNDKAILGIYSYFDHRYVGKNFSVNGLTSGIEVLSKYFDARANIYIPQEKRKQIVTNKNKTIEINGTSIYATSRGHKYATALKGYDIEAGIPLFWFSNFLNDKFGTKIYGARYDFRGKQVSPITGNRFRLEQDIGNIYLGKNSYTFRLETGTQYDKVRKRQNYVGLGLKIAFGDKQNLNRKRSNGLDRRMMETVIRDKLMHAKFKKGQFEELEEQLKIKQKELELKRQKLNNESRVMLLEHTRLKNQLDETNLEEDHEVILLQSKQEKNKMRDHLLEVRTFREEKKVWRLEYNQLVEEIKTWKLECNQLGEEKKILKLERDQLREEIKLKQLKRIVQK